MPKLSIIIPAYNMNAQLNRCLLTIRKTIRLPYEVIIVDDGSSADECVTVPAAGDDVRVIRRAEHRGFSYAVNMGIRASVGEVVLFLHADILLAPHAAEDMLDALIRDSSIGAVTAVAPRTYALARRLPETNYQSWSDFAAVAERIRSGGVKPHPEIFAEMIALMVRRDVVESVGFLDEQYVMPPLAAYDYTLRMTQAGYAVASLPNVYVHHDDRVYGWEACEQQEYEKFQAKWGLSLNYSFALRSDLFPLMDLSREGLRVLEIGCACGVTLREIGSRNPTAKLYGVELNERAAAIAAPFVQILTMNVEHLDPASISWSRGRRSAIYGNCSCRVVRSLRVFQMWHISAISTMFSVDTGRTRMPGCLTAHISGSLQNPRLSSCLRVQVFLLVRFEPRDFLWIHSGKSSEMRSFRFKQFM